MPIGFFDSGVGGLSVLREAIKLMPNEDYIYFGDSNNAPYGVRTTEDVRNLTNKAVELLLKKGAKAIVIACNTATSAAVAALRVDYPEVPIVGIEPAVKPAVSLNRKGPIIIMATPMTLKEEKFNKLMNKYKEEAEIIPMQCAGLVEFIEAGELDSERLVDYLNEKFSAYKGKDIAAIVLGCTHYPFVTNKIKDIIGNDIPIIDGGLGTCKELRRRLEERDLVSSSQNKGSVQIYNSLDDIRMIQLSEKLLNN